MRKLHLLAALAGLSALAAATGPAAADPVRLDEAGLGGVAAGADVAPAGVPGLSLLTSQTGDTRTSSTSTSSSVSSAIQSLTGATDNVNYATGISSQDVRATGNAVSSVTGTIAR
jgi:hypothetical protein